MTTVPSTRRRWLLWAVRALVLLLVCLGVSGTVRTALAQLADYRWEIDLLWLVASGVIYLAGLAPMAWFLRRTLLAMGERPAGLAALQAYYLGHLGKYVPGKALTIILRVGALRPHVASIRAAVLASLLETLTMMSVGAALGAVLAIVVLHLDARLGALAVAIAVAAGLPTLPPVARWLTRLALSWSPRLPDRDAPPAEQAAASPLSLSERAGVRVPEERLLGNCETMPAGITARLLVSGWLAAVVCWIGLGLSLWALLRSIGVLIDPLAGLPLLVAAVALAVVAGFLSLLPGGIVVRDAILLELLASSCGDAIALVAAVLLRLVWLVSEVGICAILYVGARGQALSAARR